MYSSDELFQRSGGGLFLCLFPALRSNAGNKHKNNTRMSTETVRDESAYIILFLTRHNVSINDDKNDDLYTSSPCLTRSVFVLWRHNRLLMTSQQLRKFDRNLASAASEVPVKLQIDWVNLNQNITAYNIRKILR